MSTERPRPADRSDDVPGPIGPPGRSARSAARWRDRARYRFDLALARGPLVVIGYLGLIMVVIIVVSALLLTTLRLTGIDGGGRLGLANALWQSLLRVLDTGTFAGDNHWPTRIISLVVTVAGIFLAGSLIGLIANAVDQQIDTLRKGRSAVLEDGHTLVLGWSARLPTILSELVIANANHRRRAFVVLADRPKDELEAELSRLVPDTRGTRVVCRTGDAGDTADLRLVNVEGARSVIVLAGDDGDAGVVKTLLALRSIDPDFARIRVVAELEDAGHAATLRSLTDGRIATVQAESVIGQVTAQACHQSGLAGVFRDLLDFDGDEIYFAGVPELVGHTYREALRAFEEASVLGLFRDGRVVLNPSPAEVFRTGDEVIAVAADDDRLVFTGFVDDVNVERVSGTPFAEPRRRIALIGWSSLGATVLRELDHFVGDGSVVDVLVDGSIFTAADVDLPECSHCSISVQLIGREPTALLGALGEHDYDQAIVLGYRRSLEPAQADARSMLTLLALYRAWAGRARRPRVVAEMLDHTNVPIAQTTGADDFIVSDELSSLMIAQLSERLDLQAVFDELFAAEGCYISLHPAVLYAPEHATTFTSVVASAAERGVTAIGYRLGRAQAVLNPPKSASLLLGADDQVLVLAPRAPRPATVTPGIASEVPAQVLPEPA